MGSEGAYTPAHFEVRCPRCDVSFPPETRRCIHCGGPTSKPGPNKGRDWVHTTDGDSANGGASASSPSAGSPSAGSDSMAGWERELERGRDRNREFEPEPRYTPEPFGGQERAGAEAGEGQGSWPRTLLRTGGSLLWIVVLIAFTLMRNCTKEG